MDELNLLATDEVHYVSKYDAVADVTREVLDQSLHAGPLQVLVRPVRVYLSVTIELYCLMYDVIYRGTLSP